MASLYISRIRATFKETARNLWRPTRDLWGTYKEPLRYLRGKCFWNSDVVEATCRQKPCPAFVWRGYAHVIWTSTHRRLWGGATKQELSRLKIKEKEEWVREPWEDVKPWQHRNRGFNSKRAGLTQRGRATCTPEHRLGSLKDVLYWMYSLGLSCVVC